MVKIDKILKIIDRSAAKSVKERAAHRNRVIKAVNWFEKNSQKSDLEGFVKVYVNYKKYNCLCTHVNLVYPCALFELRPLNVRHDIGNGCGKQVTVYF